MVLQQVKDFGKQLKYNKLKPMEENDEGMLPVDSPKKKPINNDIDRPIEQGGPTVISSNLRKYQAEEFDQKAIIICQFCGGEACPQQDYLKNKKQPNAIEGLHSNWITQNILATQRPSERLIKKFQVYESFKRENIKTILNLQQPGQHPYCGDGIIPTIGFSYIPQRFFAHGIRFFNESWEDMTATSFEQMMNIMDIFDLTVKNGGKIAVHCHAGRGRTLLAICSWLIYYDRMPAQETINLAVQKRQGVLTKSSQRQFLHDFQKELSSRWKSFWNHDGSKESFTEYVQWQTVSIVKSQSKKLNYTPYLHGNVTRQLKQRLKTDSETILYAFINTNNKYFKEQFSQTMEKQLHRCKELANSIRLKFHQLDTRMLVELLFDYYDQLPYTLVTSHTIDDIQQIQTKNPSMQKLDVLCQPSIIHDIGVATIAVILDFLNFFNNLKSRLMDKDPSLLSLLYLRLAYSLFSKKKYCPKIFDTKSRSCMIENEKLHKYFNKKIIFLKDFLQKLSIEIPQDDHTFERVFMKFRKVNSYLYYFTQQHRRKNKHVERQEAVQIYQQSKIKIR